MDTQPIPFAGEGAEEMSFARPEQLEPPPPPSPPPGPDNPPWGLPGALMLLVLSFVLMIVAQVALLIPYVFWRGVKLDALGEFALKDAGAIFVQIVSIIPAHLLTLGLAWLLVTRVGKYPFFKMLGWEWGSRFNFWRSALLAVVLLSVGYLVVQFAEHFTGPTDNALERLIQSSRATALATAFAATFTAPIVEEIVFRGLLYSALQRLVGAGWAVTVVMLLFALIHVPQYWPSYGVIATILLLSFVLTMIRARTGKLLPCFVVHFVFNSIQAAGIVLTPYIDSLSPPKPAPDPALLVELLHNIFRATF